MGKIKIHKKSIKMFEDYDIVVANIINKYNEINNWVLIYREHRDDDKIGAYCCFLKYGTYFEFDVIFKNDRYVKGNNIYFDKCEINNLRYATDEERKEMIKKLKESRFDLSKSPSPFKQSYIDIINEILYMIDG